MQIKSKSLTQKKDLVLCEDGSHTLYSHDFDEPYHSTKDGALHESLEKYVKPTFALKKDKSSLVILDICFGLGYNTFSTLYYLKKNDLKIKVHILSPEFDEALLRSLEHFTYPKAFDEIAEIIKKVSKELYYSDEQFTIEVLLGDAREQVKKIEQKVDVVYQDAFSPAHNPLLWTTEWFKDIRAICKDDAILTTYSTAITTRMGLYENGFYIFIHCGEKFRNATVASLKMLDKFEYVDMELKQQRNKEARSLKDAEYLEDEKIIDLH
jgi:tRNA U34 5-methylaminomethyl-2-thiouridine-forming methyltransferase MnmC